MQNSIEIKSILKDFYTVSGIRISIHDTEFNEIYSYPAEATPFCKYLQQNSAILQDCRNNDSAAFQEVKRTGSVFVYKCRRGLYEAVAPIYHYGTLSGYLMMGQICDGSPEALNIIINRTEEILGDREKAIEISKGIKTINRNQIDSYMNIMLVLAEYLTGTNRLITHNEKLPMLIKEYIHKNYSDKITLNIISQKFGCCNATLTKSFKKEYNFSIMEYLCNIRLEKAAEMIRKTRKSFKEISNECGFYDQNYFSKLFAKKYGCSPTEYKNRNI